MIIQTSCSELLVDTKLHDVNIAYKQIKMLFDKFELASDPLLSKELLKELKESCEKEYRLEIMIYDKLGNRCWLEYGDNGYTETGFRFDTHCNHGDEKCFPIFKKALNNLKQSELEAYDGGSTDWYEKWEVEKC